MPVEAVEPLVPYSVSLERACQDVRVVEALLVRSSTNVAFSNLPFATLNSEDVTQFTDLVAYHFPPAVPLADKSYPSHCTLADASNPK